jgi:hypothetical protein
MRERALFLSALIGDPGASTIGDISRVVSDCRFWTFDERQ